eukprot:10016015-Alexandrium_andersonii.AAC.1
MDRATVALFRPIQNPMTSTGSEASEARAASNLETSKRQHPHISAGFVSSHAHVPLGTRRL